MAKRKGGRNKADRRMKIEKGMKSSTVKTDEAYDCMHNVGKPFII